VDCFAWYAIRKCGKKWGDTSKAIVLHGTSDRLVPFENVAYLENKIPDKKNLKTIILKGEDHFLPWTRFDLIKDELLFLLQSLTRQC
jgi:pimeloyl-ACP methyl ester carboxylesterase